MECLPCSSNIRLFCFSPRHGFRHSEFLPHCCIFCQSLASPHLHFSYRPFLIDNTTVCLHFHARSRLTGSLCPRQGADGESSQQRICPIPFSFLALWRLSQTIFGQKRFSDTRDHSGVSTEDDGVRVYITRASPICNKSNTP